MTAVASALLAYFQNGVPLYAVILIGAAVFFLLSFAWYFVTRRRILADRAQIESSADPQTTQPPTALIEAEVAKVTETLNAQHAAEIASLKLQHADRILGYERGWDDLKRRHDALQARLDEWQKYDWLTSIATVQAQDIDHYVKLDRIERGDIQLNDGVPFVKFGLWVVNNSVFDITLELGRGNIYFRELRLDYAVSIVSSNRLQTGFCGTAHIALVIEQRLSREEAYFISSSEARDDAIFYFDRLPLTIEGGKRHPPVTPKRLDINKGVTLHNEPLVISR